MFMLGALTLLRSDFECTTRCFMMLMDQKKCFRYFFWPPAGKILKYWIRNPCYNAKIFKLETSISDPKIAQTHIPDLEFHKKINRKWHRSDGNLLLVLDSSLGQKLEMRNFWCSKPWWKLVFWSETKLENRVSEGVRQKCWYFSKDICMNFILSSFQADSFPELEGIKKNVFGAGSLSLIHIWRCRRRG